MKKILLAGLFAATALTAQADLTIDFNNYNLGQLSGQNGWTADVTELNRSNIAAGGLFGDVTGNHLALSGTSSPNNKMNRWIAVPVTLTGSTYVGMDFRMGASGNTDPSELFFGFHSNAATNSAPWNSYIAFKRPSTGDAAIEGTGSGGLITAPEVLLDFDLRVGTLFSVDANNVLNSMSVWFNPTIGGNGLPTGAADYTWAVTGTTDLTTLNLLKIRAQNMPTMIDNISIVAVPEPAAYAALFGLVALGLAARRRQRS